MGHRKQGGRSCSPLAWPFLSMGLGCIPTSLLSGTSSPAWPSDGALLCVFFTFILLPSKHLGDC